MSAPTDSTYPADAETTLAMLRAAIARMPSNVDAMIGLAGTHLRLGQLDDAAQWCARAAALEQSTRISRLRAAVEDVFVKRALHEVIRGRMDSGIATLARASKSPGSGTAPLYRDLFMTASRWFAEADQAAPEPGAIRLSLPVWGADYVAAVSTGLLPSMLAPGNIPALAAQRVVRLEIATTERDRAALEAAPIMRTLRRHAAVDYRTLPDAIVPRPSPQDYTYWVMSAAHHAALALARRAGTDLSFLTADMILSDGCLQAAQRLLDCGTQAVLISSALEVDRTALPPVDPQCDAPLSLPARTLIDHGLAQLGIDANEPEPCRVRTPSSFAVKGGLATYGFHFLPLMIATDLLRREFTSDLLTVDTRMIRLALGDAAPEGRIKIVCDPREIAVVSTMSGSRGASVPSAETFARWAAFWCFEPQDVPYFEWCFGHRIVHSFSGAAIAPPDARERATVAEVAAAFRHHAALRVAERKAS